MGHNKKLYKWDNQSYSVRGGAKFSEWHLITFDGEYIANVYSEEPRFWTANINHINSDLAETKDFTSKKEAMDYVNNELSKCGYVFTSEKYK